MVGVSWERYTCTPRKTCYFFVSWHTGRPSSRCEELFYYYYFLSFCERSARETRHVNRRYLLLHNDRACYAKRDSCLAAYGGVVLQPFEFIKVCMRMQQLCLKSRLFLYFVNKIYLPCYCVVFFIVCQLPRPI